MRAVIVSFSNQSEDSHKDRWFESIMEHHDQLYCHGWMHIIHIGSHCFVSSTDRKKPPGDGGFPMFRPIGKTMLQRFFSCGFPPLLFQKHNTFLATVGVVDNYLIPLAGKHHIVIADGHFIRLQSP